MYLNIDPKHLSEILRSSTHPQAPQILGELNAHVAEIGTLRHAEVIEQARESYVANSDGDIEIDRDAIVSEGDGGFFVHAWIHVPKE